LRPAQSPNRLLSALPQNIFVAMAPDLQRVKLVFGDEISQTNQPISQVYFPFSGVVSLIVDMSVGDMIETAMVGIDGGTIALHRPYPDAFAIREYLAAPL
jgi:hypothetical protein